MNADKQSSCLTLSCFLQFCPVRRKLIPPVPLRSCPCISASSQLVRSSPQQHSAEHKQALSRKYTGIRHKPVKKITLYIHTSKENRAEAI